MKPDLALVADLGGTNIRFALADPDASMPLCNDSVRRFRVTDFASLTDAAASYLSELGARPRQAVFAVAGRVGHDSAQITNHSWRISIDATRLQLGLERLRLVNDFEALSLALPLLAEADLCPLGPNPVVATAHGQSRTCVVLGPGTGLGVAALICRDGQYQALASEGGHVGFAPVEDEEIEVLQCLRSRFGRVSVERLVSGPGLSNLYQAVCTIRGRTAPVRTPESITGRAAGGDPDCVYAVELCASLLARIAGDLVLTFGAWDGAYLAGGLTRQLLPWLQSPRFRQRFEDKGRFSGEMARVPAAAIVHPDAGLLGSAALATCRG